jgi:hypothetical protein
MLNPTVDFSEAIAFNIEEMVADGAVNRSSHLFESIIQFARKGTGGAFEFSDRKGASLLGQSAVDSILSFLPTLLQKL